MMTNENRIRGRPSNSQMTLSKTGMTRTDSKGLMELWDKDTQRREGSSLIARQVELENMKFRQWNDKKKVHDKNQSLRQEQKMNQYLEKIHREHFQVEKW